MRYRLIGIAPLLLTILAGCGEGYRIVPARLNIVVVPESFPGAATTCMTSWLGKDSTTSASTRR